MADNVLGQKTAIYILVNGQLVSEMTSITISMKSNSTPTKSVPKGLSGITPGAATCEITFELNIPVDDFEYNPSGAIRLNQEVEFGLVAAGRQSAPTGYVTGLELKHGVDSNAVQTVTCLAEYKDFE